MEQEFCVCALLTKISLYLGFWMASWPENLIYLRRFGCVFFCLANGWDEFQEKWVWRGARLPPLLTCSDRGHEYWTMGTRE